MRTTSERARGEQKKAAEHLRERYGLGAAGDGLSLTPEVDGSFYLNSYSWPILAEAADEGQNLLDDETHHFCHVDFSFLKFSSSIMTEQL